MPQKQHRLRLPRRRFLEAVSVFGVSSSVFGRALLAQAEDAPRITSDMIRQAEGVAGLSFNDEKRKLLAKGLNGLLDDYEKLRSVVLDNGVPPALTFVPAPSERSIQAAGESAVRAIDSAPAARPASDEDLAFAPVTELASLIRARQVSSVELTRMYLDRLHRYDPALHCVITFTDDLALRQAEAADKEIAAGRYRGALHGIPWGAKDLLAHPDQRTTWGATPYRDQVRREKATVVARLEEAGAVLIAKLAVGALAWGDVWFGATTRNPWKTDQGSSGSSAGPASATAAGLAGFSIGTETWGSIISPCTRCGATGLRPTFGRVSRHGTMALSWSMDKIGPIARGVEDCALVLGAIHGADGLDGAAVDRPFAWPPKKDVRTLRVGYAASLFENDPSEEIEDEELAARMGRAREFDRATLDVLRREGFKLVRVELPDSLPTGALSLILTAEAAAAFDEFTRSGGDDRLYRQIENAWPNVFRQGQMIPAVEYIRANRIRTLLMREMEALLSELDGYVCPTFGGDNLLASNLTGHPAVVLPNGFHEDGTPGSVTFTGRLFGETELLSLARAYQQATGFHLRRPALDAAPTPARLEQS